FLTTSPEPTEVWCWFISAVLWGSLSASAGFFVSLYFNCDKNVINNKKEGEGYESQTCHRRRGSGPLGGS
ncbi:hypothetical protein PTQ47_05275, partial [Klebsiella michiganensis]|uniref:hypothetical protein n=1 Tax=Klebsiella michiganensis TaxID=1134687 RepID=UPI00287ECC21